MREQLAVDLSLIRMTLHLLMHRSHRPVEHRYTMGRRIQCDCGGPEVILPYADHPDYDEAWRP